MEFLEDSEEELKRVDHLIYVSLKYTRTVDVFKNIFMRMINASDFLIDGILESLKEKNKISEVPPAFKLKCDIIRAKLNDEKINNFLDNYLLLKALSTAEYTKKNEFRRHVTMMAELRSGALEDVNIDKIHEYYKDAKDFLEHVKDLVENKVL